MNQLKLPTIDDFFLSQRLEESRALVREMAERSEIPLIIQFSGGKDSMAVLGLVREMTENFVCAYMATGLEFNGVVQFVRKTCKEMGVTLLVSHPGLHKGNLFKRIEQFRRFPGMLRPWCCRDLKLRPQKKLLHETYGKGAFYKLEGVRLSESSRRKYIYKGIVGTMMRPDDEHKGSFEVFPILHWTDDDVLNFLDLKGLPTSGLYEQYGVSGCSWCPFYGADIYRRVLRQVPNHYDRFIEWEERLGQPSVVGFTYLRDLKREVLTGAAPEADEEAPARRPCTMVIEGKEVRTCDVYGHFYVDGCCFRCDAPE